MLLERKALKSLVLKSSPENIIEVEPFIEGIRAELDISDDVFGNILISITEAVNNGILHGNSGDESKEVNIETMIDEKGKVLSIVVRDEGDGFDYNNLPDPTSPENLEKMSGRGIFIIKQLCDLVVFSDDGSAIEMQFKL